MSEVITRASVGRSARTAETSTMLLLGLAAAGLGQTLALRAKLSPLNPAEARLVSPLKPDASASRLTLAGLLPVAQ